MIKIDDQSVEWREGMTVADLLEQIDDPFPYAVVRVNGKTVTRAYFKSYPVPDEAEVFLVPLIAGG